MCSKGPLEVAPEVNHYSTSSVLKTGTFAANDQADCNQILTANPGNTRNNNA